MQTSFTIAFLLLSLPNHFGSGFQVRSPLFLSPLSRWDDQKLPPTALTADEECEIVETPYMLMNCDPDFDAQLDRPDDIDLFSILNIAVPAITPLLSFLLYEEVAQMFSFTIDILGPNTWVAVDGGAYQAKIIAPAINGVVVPAIAVLFATLTSTTISSLRDRQVQVRNAINMEAGELRALEVLMEAFPSGAAKERSRDYLIQYTSRIISESSPGTTEDTVTNPRRGMDSELNAFMNLLNQQQGPKDDEFIPPHVLSEAFSSVSKLREQRQGRITALQSTFPVLHYVVLGLLAFAQCTAFLMETNTQSLLFLSALQLRILWSMLTSTFVACFAVFADMRSLFSGSYQILPCVDQLYIIRLTLQASARMEEIERKQAEQQRIEEEQDQMEKRRQKENELFEKERQEAEEEGRQIHLAVTPKSHGMKTVNRRESDQPTRGTNGSLEDEY